MKIKTSELSGVALDWAVAKIENPEWWDIDPMDTKDCLLMDGGEWYSPSNDWAQGGPIIEREVITLIHPRYDCWTAHKYDDRLEDESYTLNGPTPLIAAMRCFVASEMGDEVEVPDELMESQQ